jgi:hypothetical protein
MSFLLRHTTLVVATVLTLIYYVIQTQAVDDRLAGTVFVRIYVEF